MVILFMSVLITSTHFMEKEIIFTPFNKNTHEIASQNDFNRSKIKYTSLKMEKGNRHKITAVKIIFAEGAII